MNFNSSSLLTIPRAYKTNTVKAVVMFPKTSNPLENIQVSQCNEMFSNVALVEFGFFE
jgi:hypothetical protein